MHINIIYCLLFYLFCIGLCLEAKAQQTIINVPSSDILPRGDIILKDSNRFRPFNPDPYVTITPSITLGVGYATEISAGVATSISDDTSVKGSFAAKKVIFLGNLARFTIGTRFNPDLTQTIAPDNFTYAHLSTRIRKTRTSLTAGMFIAGKQEYLPDQPGALLGLDQVIIPNKLRFAMDWISRNESYGLLGVGLKYRPVPTVSLTNAILIPNGNKGNLSFSISISKDLSLKNRK